MLNPKEIKLSHKSLFQEFLKNNESSTNNFTTLYMWSLGGRIKYDIVNDSLIFFYYGKNCHIGVTYPMGENRVMVAEKAYDYMKNKGEKPRFILMPEEAAKECENVFDGRFSVFSDPDNADYVYESEKLINLSGKKLHSKKNHLNAFKNTYNFSYEKLTSKNVDECKALFLNWKKELKNHSSGISEEATLRLLDNIDKLSVTLGGIRVDGKLIAFSAGEKITDDMALIHIEYADTSIRGAFNIMNQQFAENEWSDCTFINREEDMGIEGLRKAKMAYRPVRMIEKYFTKI